MFSLNDKVAIVTGSTKGIGRAIAETLLDEGASVAICARDADGVAEAVDQLAARGTVWGKAVDAGNSESLRGFIAEAIVIGAAGWDHVLEGGGATASGGELAVLALRYAVLFCMWFSAAAASTARR